jgi:hypothetical protein
MSDFEERLRQLNHQEQDRAQRERSEAARAAAEASENERGTAVNRGLVTRITAALGKTATSLRSSFSGGRAPEWHESLDGDGGGFFIIPSPTRPLGEVMVSLTALPTAVKCTVAASRGSSGPPAFSKAHEFTTPVGEDEVKTWVESMLHDAFAVFYAAQN